MMGKVGFIGAGNMAEAIIGGIVKKGVYAPADICIYDIQPGRTQKLSSLFQVSFVSSSQQLVRDCPTVVLAVKPGVLHGVIEELKDLLADRLLISIAAGVSLDKITSVTGKDARVVRVMPNTPALVLEGVSAFCASDSCTREDLEGVRAIFSAVGMCREMDEGLLNAVTALSGSGPAFGFMFIEALSDGAVRAGLPRDIALSFAAATLKGAAAMALETGIHPGKLKDMVTSPSGTTIEGVAVLESKAFRSAVMDAVFAAYKRAEELT